MKELTEFEKRDQVLKNISNSLKKIIDQLDEDELDCVSQEESDIGLVVELILQGVLGKYEISKYHELRLRGALKRLHLLDDFGGYLDINHVASMMKVEPHYVQELIDKNKLLSIRVSEQHRIPAFQFHNDQIIFGLSRVLESLHSQDHKFWASFLFLINPHDAMYIGKENVTPLDALKDGQLDFVLGIVSNINNQTAY